MTPVANLPQVSTTPAAKLPPVSTTSAANLPPVSMTWRKIFPSVLLGVADTGGKFATGVNNAGGKLPPVSTTTVANNGSNYQNADNLKWTWKKIDKCAISTTQRCPKEIINILLIEDFFHLPGVSLTPVANLEPWISQRIFEQIWNGPNGIIRGLRETDSWKKPEAKNLVTLSL